MKRSLSLGRKLVLRFGAILAGVGVSSIAMAMRLEGASLIVAPLIVLLGLSFGVGWLVRRAFDVTLTVGKDGVYIERRSSKKFVAFAEVESVERLGAMLLLRVRGVPAFVLSVLQPAEHPGELEEIIGRIAQGRAAASPCRSFGLRSKLSRTGMMRNYLVHSDDSRCIPPPSLISARSCLPFERPCRP